MDKKASEVFLINAPLGAEVSVIFSRSRSARHLLALSATTRLP